MPIASRLPIYGRPRKDLFRDDFTSAAINTGLWTVTDTESKLSVSGGNLVCAGGKATPAWDDPRISGIVGYAARAGRLFQAPFNWSTLGANGSEFGLDGSTPVVVAMQPGFRQQGSSLVIQGAIALSSVGLSTATDYVFRVVLLNPGALWYYSTDAGATWKALWHESSGYTSTVYPGIDNNNSVFTCGQMRVYDRAVPRAVVSDTFTRADSASTLGSAESGQAWTVGNNNDAAVLPTFGITSNAAYMAVGGDQGQPHAWVESNVADGVIEGSVITPSFGATGTAGLLFRRADGQNFFAADYNRTDGSNVIRVIRRLAGTTSVVASAALAGTDGVAVGIKVVLVGSSIQVYADGVRMLNYTDSNMQTATKHGLYTNGSNALTSRFDDFAVWPGLTS